MRFRRIRRRFAALTPFGKIGVIVAGLHLCALLTLAISHLASPTPKPPAPIAVRIRLPQKPVAAAPKPVAVAAKPVKPKKALAPPAKKPAAMAAPAPQPQKKAAPEIRLPALLEKSPVETAIETTSATASFGESLSALLQEQLQLPEIGEVKARIVLVAPGKIDEVEILDARSEKNSAWLKNQLPRLSVPCFNDFSIRDAKLEFTITFRNVEKI